ncbi:Gfo/Idh/MocA family protein [Rhizobium leguminosarum]|uniref:Gfo/Idh/MocA family protein n=1 Tax=Rhizobium leguminosarum TaxID=384 RepID=UPI001C9127F5|nr:Gfo/Idh/MocA family oxidoreductase [Rhizobium leguminosarum]MBY2919525.1 Gfo/Idh/MocA family oxidoreductase [Rhizobium leguminosarum]MBY2975132.1 Gfo/Idh/MocA family oxidoreductase [Rhizobium leguminosarum]MBY2982566.1 Gfo/Idh/MocA family oxidoreductase [Rhizobium leguminosarum]MBY3001259.1 Gfo/Idh/MocA family oxidoreductase [Rhizobium leguminosarum]MBY3011080.1 Gfo/Idh/MocA family oxidoreductase [Rhizobium leguminosarum]
MIGIAVVGYGYWGPNLVRNISEAAGAHLVSVCDLNVDRLAAVKSRYPAVTITDDFEEVLRDPRVDAIAIATPVFTHFKLAMQAMMAGKHVFVEKPMASTTEEASRMVEEAARRRLVLAVDHTFVHTGAVRKMRELVENGLGDMYYYDSVRVNLGLFQHDVSVIWDLAVHDLSILDHVVQERPVAVSATGMSHVLGEPENIAYLTLFFGSKLIAHIHVNWLAPVKVRRTLIGGSNKMIVYDDLEPSEKIKVYDKGITLNPNSQAYGEKVHQMMVGYRSGDMWAPKLDMTEALKRELDQFVECIEQNSRPITDGHAGLRVVRILEAASRSLAQRGRIIELEEARRIA